MLDLNIPENLERYIQAGREYKKYNYRSKKSNYKRYVSFDMQKKQMNVVRENMPFNIHTYPVGELLQDFANLDLSKYEEERQRTIQLLEDPATEYFEVGYYIGHLERKEPTESDIVFNKLVCIDRLIKRFEDLHPYFYVLHSDYVTLKRHDPMQLIQEELDLISLQNKIREYIDLCMNDQVKAIYSQIKPVQRYLLHHETMAQMPFFTNKSTLYVRIQDDKGASPNAFSSEQIEYLHEEFPQLFEGSRFYEKPDISHMAMVLKRPLVVEEGYAVQTIRDIAMLEISKMIVLNMRVRRCKFCGKLFAPKGKHNTRYCNRIPEGYTQTCQALGSSRNYSEKMQKENADALYRKMYKRLHQRKQKGAMTEKSFKKWQGDAQYQLERCKNGEITLEEFEELIKK